MTNSERKRALAELYEVVLWLAILSVLYIISLNNYLLFKILIELFSVYVAYVIFLNGEHILSAGSIAFNRLQHGIPEK